MYKQQLATLLTTFACFLLRCECGYYVCLLPISIKYTGALLLDFKFLGQGSSYSQTVPSSGVLLIDDDEKSDLNSLPWKITNN